MLKSISATVFKHTTRSAVLLDGIHGTTDKATTAQITASFLHSDNSLLRISYLLLIS